MPLVKVEQIFEETKILIWRIEEDVSLFEAGLKPLYPDPPPWEAMKEKRRKEFLATRYLLQWGLPEGASIAALEKDRYGCPSLPAENLFLGISHTRDLAGGIISRRRAGCDIEEYQPRILRLAPKFMTNEEMARAEGPDQLMKTHLIWGIKESSYKTWGRRGIDWKADIRIDPVVWNPGKGTVSGQIGKAGSSLSFTGGYQYFDRFLFVWTVEI